MIKSIRSNWLLTILKIGVTFALLPFTIKVLGESRYGTWLLITAMTSYLSMLALGIPMATVRFVANLADDEERLNRAVGSCAGLYLAIGLASAVIGAGLFLAFEHLYTIPADSLPDARWAFGLTVLFISAGFIGQLPYGIMAAHHDFVLRNWIQVASLALRLALTLTLLSIDASIVWLALIQLTCLAGEFGVAMLFVRRRWPHIRVRLSDFDPALVREILGFSVFVMLLNIGSQLAFQSDALVIAAFLPVDTIPHFAVAGSLAVYLMEFVIGIGAVVMPMAASLQAKGRLPELRTIFLKWSKITVSLTVASCAFLIVLGPRFLGWWIDPAFEGTAGPVLQVLMLGNLVFLPVRGVALPLLMGLGKPRVAAMAFLASGVLNVGLSIALARPLGLIGVAIGTAVPNALFAIFVLALACRELEVGLGEYLRYAVLRDAIAAIPVFAVLVWFRDVAEVRSLPGLALAGAATVSLGTALAVAFVYRGDPQLDLRGLILARVRPRGRKA